MMTRLVARNTEVNAMNAMMRLHEQSRQAMIADLIDRIARVEDERRALKRRLAMLEKDDCPDFGADPLPPWEEATRLMVERDTAS